jgi:predicted SprT family Zn-dependent metalloprotease
MEPRKGSKILVNPDALKSASLNEVGSSIGHELIHINDYLRGRTARPPSELRAYKWEEKHFEHFNMSSNQRYKLQVLGKIGYWRKKVNEANQP